jgi:hypothetical protein
MTIDGRIKSLEDQVRTLRRMLLGVFALAAVAGLLAANTLQVVPDVIKAKKFEVVNGEGEAVVELGSNKAGGVVGIGHRDGHRLIELMAHLEGGTVSILNRQKKSLVLIGVNEHGSGALQTRNNKGQTLVSLATSLTGAGTVSTENGEGQKTSTMP